MNRILLFLLLPLFISCDTKETSPITFFGGEIVNPTSEFVVLFKDDIALDSSRLDVNNRFAFSLNNLSEGLHHFSHDPEKQYIYLEQGDSVQIRLNTIDFDESLVFSGQGEEVNNFLIEMFLASEEEQRLVKNTYCSLEVNDFEVKIDSLKTNKINRLNNIASEFSLSSKALEMASASINYTNYTYREFYPFYHKRRMSETEIHNLPDNFYSYRKDINYKGDNLTYLRPYYNFMLWHFENLSFMECEENCAAYTNLVKDKLHFNNHKLKIIDSLAKGKELKDNLYRNVAIDYLLKANENKDNNDSFIQEFYKFSKNNKHITEIESLYQGLNKLQPANKLPNIAVLDISGNQKSLTEVTGDKNVILYFWSATNRRHFNNVTKRIALLSKKHPKYKFIGINLRTDDIRWKTMISSRKLDQKNQYRAVSNENMEHSLMIFQDRNKCVKLNDGLIVDAFANLYRSF